VLAAVFVTAGVGKLLDLRGSSRALFGFGVPERVAAIGGPLLPVAELATAIALVLRPSARWGAVAALLLLVTFMGGIVNVVARGRTASCHCFGIFHSAPASLRTLARNAVLAALAGAVVGYGRGPSISTWASDRSAAELVAIGLGLAAAVVAAVALGLRRDKSRLEHELNEAKATLAALPPGLPVGALAPDFSLPEARGGTLSLSELRSRGLPILLVFVGRGCMPSMKLEPDLARWQSALAERLTIALISWGEPEHNWMESEALGIKDIGLQRGFDFEQTKSYRVRGTPSAVLISPHGRIAASFAESAPAIEALVRIVLRNQLPVPETARNAVATA
jgi:hypothetical protein